MKESLTQLIAHTVLAFRVAPPPVEATLADARDALNFEPGDVIKASDGNAYIVMNVEVYEHLLTLKPASRWRLAWIAITAPVRRLVAWLRRIRD